MKLAKWRNGEWLLWERRPDEENIELPPPPHKNRKESDLSVMTHVNGKYDDYNNFNFQRREM
jgi:hypothetical protein